ncbi:hypothetical protein Ancab_033428 [Ancistrocladus abbreviatus]
MEVKLEPQSLSRSNSLRRRSNASNSPEFEFWMVRNPSFPPPNLLSADELFSQGVLLPLHLLHHHHHHHSHDPDSAEHSPPDSVGLGGDQPNADTSIPNSAQEADEPPEPEPDRGQMNEPSPSIVAEYSSSAATTSVLTASKRWRDIFKKKLSENHNNNNNDGEERGDHGKKKEKEKKREKKNGSSSSSNSTSAELNINIWPFSRSKSAGNNSVRPRATAAAAAMASRKVSSAPCSRSNSAGESKSRKWPTSPGRGGLHVGRASPVWQVRRVGSGGRSSESLAKNIDKGVRKDIPSWRRNKSGGNGGGGGMAGNSGGGKGKVLNLNVPMCIGYRNNLTCRRDERSAIGAGGNGINVAEDGGQTGGSVGDSGQSGGGGSTRNVAGGGGNLFNLRSLFTKKAY